MAAVLLAVLALAACGERGGAGTAATGRAPADDEVRLVVSRDFGGELLHDVVVPAGEHTDALRVLAENADVDTSYGGGFVSGIDGLSSSFGGGSSGAADWFYWVDGAMGDVGAADTKLKGGETVWWDYHEWGGAMVMPAALHAFPRPYAGRRLEVTAAADVTGLEEWAAASGLDLAARRPLSGDAPDGGLVLATAAEAAETPWLAALLSADHGGVAMVRAAEGALTLLSPEGERGPSATAVAQPVANTASAERPFLIVLGVTPADFEALLPRLTTESLTASVAVALVDGGLVRLPWFAR